MTVELTQDDWADFRKAKAKAKAKEREEVILREARKAGFSLSDLRKSGHSLREFLKAMGCSSSKG